MLLGKAELARRVIEVAKAVAILAGAVAAVSSALVSTKRAYDEFAGNKKNNRPA